MDGQQKRPSQPAVSYFDLIIDLWHDYNSLHLRTYSGPGSGYKPNYHSTVTNIKHVISVMTDSEGFFVGYYAQLNDGAFVTVVKNSKNDIEVRFFADEPPAEIIKKH